MIVAGGGEGHARVETAGGGCERGRLQAGHTGFSRHQVAVHRGGQGWGVQGGPGWGVQGGQQAAGGRQDGAHAVRRDLFLGLFFCLLLMIF